MQGNKIGSVTLIGAGCGRDLITVKGLNALKNADVIVYDALIDSSVLDGLTAEKIYAGKRAGKHSRSQSEINKILIENAKKGLRVARLKGGDSFVFGRGGEEALALKKENIPYEVIPGVTSAVAVPERLGIPVTHREISRSFAVVTGHTAGGDGENFEALAALDGTLVFLMGLYKIDEICKRLIENGKDSNTPASLLSTGFTPYERRIDGTLSNIAEKAKSAEPPAILVVGNSARLDLKSAFPSVSVIGTRAFCARFSSKYPNTYEFPVVEVRKKEFSFNPDDYDIVAFTSSNAVDAFFDDVEDIRTLSGLKFACVGPSSAKRLEKYKIMADFVPPVYDKRSMLDALPEKRTLVLGAGNIYKIVIKKSDIKINSPYVVFSSAASVKGFFENGADLNGSRPVCIGNSTARELSKYTDDFLTAEIHTIDGVIEVIENEAFAQNESE